MDFIQELLLDPLKLAFMQRAMLTVIIIGTISGVMGAYVVTRGMSFLGDALAHSVLPGVAIVFITGSTGQDQLLLGGLISAVISALGIGFLTRGRRIHEDVAIGIVFAGTMALGIGIISSARSFATDLQHILIGNILAVGENDLIIMAAMAIVVLVIVFLIYKELLVVSFDPILAETLRLPSETLRLILLVLLAVTIVIGVQAVGVALVSALLVTPAAAARFFVRRLHHMMILSALNAVFSGIVGMYIAWHVQVAPSAAIVLTTTALFGLAFLFAPHKGYVWMVWAHLKNNQADSVTA